MAKYLQNSSDIQINEIGDNLQFEIIKSQLLNSIYPIGSIYMSVNSTNPENFIGGTWERIQDKFLLASGSLYSAGSTGGEATHKLTIDEMPKHRHEMIMRNTGTNYYENPYPPYTAVGDTTNSSAGMLYAGGDQPHNNMPPYLAVYVWKRTA